MTVKIDRLKEAINWLALRFHFLVFSTFFIGVPFAIVLVLFFTWVEKITKTSTKYNTALRAVIQLIYLITFLWVFYFKFVFIIVTPLLNTSFVIIILVYSVFIYIFSRYNLLRALMLLIIVGLLLVLGIMVESESFIPVALMLGSTCLLIATGLLTPSGLKNADRFHLAISVFAILIFAKYTSFYFTKKPSDFDRASKQENIETLYSAVAANGDELSEFLGRNQVRKIIPGCRSDVYYIFAGSLIEYHSYSKEARLIDGNYYHEGSEIDCDKLEVIAGSHRLGDNFIRILDISSPWASIKSNMPIDSESGILRLFKDRRRDVVFFSSENNHIHSVDLVARTEKDLGNVGGKWFTLHDDMIVVMKDGNIVRYNIADGPSLTEQIVFDTGLDNYQGDIVAHPYLPRVYFNDYSSGNLVEFNYRKGAVMRVLALQPGIRYIWIDRSGDIIASVDHVNGSVFIVDANEMKLLREFYVGPRARIPSYDSINNRLLVPSSVGGWIIDMQ